MFGNCVAMMDECEDTSMTLSPDFCPSYRLNSKKLLSIIQDTNSSMSFSPEPTTSPMQNHSLNMSNLSFCDSETPKRCLDLSNLSNGGETSASPETVRRGLCLDSPGLTDAQTGEFRYLAGRTQQHLPEILCSSPMLVTSGPQTPVQDHVDFRSLGHNKENEGDEFKKPICPAPRITLLPFQDQKICETTSSTSSLFGFEMEGVSHATSTDFQCLDYPMSEDNPPDVFLGLIQKDQERNSNMNIAMSSSMAALFTGDLMNQGMDTSTVPVRRSRPGLFRSPSMPERLHKPFLKRLDRSLEMDTPVKTKRQKSFECPSEHKDQKRQEDQFMRQATTSCKINVTNVLDEERNPMELIGNFSNVYALPTTTGKHEDLKYITPEIMAKILHGEYDHLLEGVYIVDCRYPYEFEGGHIKGALNLHRADDAIDYFLKKPIISKSKDKRLIIIFHCEFSSERGPKMCRLVREEDRSMNDYPNLYYPELYILKGGYKAFFSQFMNYCDPPKYCPMDHVDFQEEMLKLRKKSKSWAGERRRRDLISRLRKM
ncbi:M-phase inducer phosphatase 1-B-like [Pristis pectinata]|uniref:M-phase inducer phosphatase 1-B-like n=1 Tax=Pristis pectinata TaxID=685728 RepID=UPI00223D5706|nr:M-phase inducer phosphatase 1-B-like [Pristis pectinata]XP_051871061.1 M-phase inducer phosphatase 1-B-like [Pristis pectinata]XP_051871062.1 M-phase inducer phosphatase 1-B-like [Pristis pectinata]XP_051871063.1 M-phase inducer phosphatase 1-B-like [Pristis pectinata]